MSLKPTKTYFNYDSKTKNITAIFSIDNPEKKVKYIKYVPDDSDPKHRLLYNIDIDNEFKFNEDEDEVEPILFNEVEKEPILSQCYDQLQNIFEDQNDPLITHEIIMNRHGMIFLSTYKYMDIWKMRCIRKNFNGKEFFVFYVSEEDMTKLTIEQMIRGATFPALITKSDVKSTFSTYKYRNWKINGTDQNNRNYNILLHFSAEIDAFIYPNFAVEIKVIKCADSGEPGLPPKTAMRILYQCKLGGVKYIIIGYHHNNRLILTETYTYKELEKYVFSRSKRYRKNLRNFNDMEKHHYNLRSFNPEAKLRNEIIACLNFMQHRKASNIEIIKEERNNTLKYRKIY